MRWTTKKKDLKDFPELLKRKRLELELSPRQVSERSNVSVKLYYKLEAGECRPSLSSYLAICRTMGFRMPLIGIPESDSKNGHVVPVAKFNVSPRFP